MEDQALDILKEAILLERRGREFYQNVADRTEKAAVKDFFETMALEEERHIKVLSEQFHSLQESGSFASKAYVSTETDAIATAVLSDRIKESIAAAGFEAAAISAAISMEERAVKLYAERAEKTNDPEEKKLYDWLSRWEQGHLNALMDMDKALLEKVWFDQQFWPF